MKFKEFYEAYKVVAQMGFDLISEYRNEYIVLCILGLLTTIIVILSLIYIENKISELTMRKIYKRLKRGA